MRMTKLEGPECPRCGCEQSELVKSTPYELRRAAEVVEAGTCERRMCQFCGERFSVARRNSEAPLNGKAN
jgi:hypothetical protein